MFYTQSPAAAAAVVRGNTGVRDLGVLRIL